jgi:hypothetical protein
MVSGRDRVRPVGAVGIVCRICNFGLAGQVGRLVVGA